MGQSGPIWVLITGADMGFNQSGAMMGSGQSGAMGSGQSGAMGSGQSGPHGFSQSGAIWVLVNREQRWVLVNREQ